MQPPSGGCVLKHTYITQGIIKALAAAFGRLCVETESELVTSSESEQQPPSGGCVLKQSDKVFAANHTEQPPSGGCVLKLDNTLLSVVKTKAAAFGRLCVETSMNGCTSGALGCSRLRAAVC